MTNLEPEYVLDGVDEVEGVTAVYLTNVLDECQELSSFEELSSY